MTYNRERIIIIDFALVEFTHAWKTSIDCAKKWDFMLLLCSEFDEFFSHGIK